jgi:hypothetical protein
MRLKPTIEKLRVGLSFLGKPIVKQKANNNTLVFRTMFRCCIPVGRIARNQIESIVSATKGKRLV